MMALSNPIAWAWLAVGLAAVALSALFSGFETGMYCLSPLRLRVRCDENRAAGRLVRRLLERREEMLVGLLIASNLCNFTATAACVMVFVQLGIRGARAESYTTILMSGILFVFAEMVPKGLFRLHADRLVYVWAPLIDASLRALRACGVLPLIRWLATTPTTWMRSATPVEALSSREAVRAMLLDTAATGVLTPYQTEIADNVLGIASVTVRSVMVPISRSVMVPSDCSYEHLRQIAVHFRYARVPVFTSQDRSRIPGIVDVTEGLLRPPEDWSVAAVMRPAPALDVTMPVLRALALLRDQRSAMGIVRDASGRTVGIVTIKDLVEEIVGELAAW